MLQLLGGEEDFPNYELKTKLSKTLHERPMVTIILPKKAPATHVGINHLDIKLGGARTLSFRLKQHLVRGNGRASEELPDTAPLDKAWSRPL